MMREISSTEDVAGRYVSLTPWSAKHLDILFDAKTSTTTLGWFVSEFDEECQITAALCQLYEDGLIQCGPILVLASKDVFERVMGLARLITSPFSA